MKKIFLLLFLICIFGCDKEDKNTKPVDQLPPETQIGANTFGFLVNGKPINVTNTSQQTAIYQGGGVQFGAGGIYIVVLEPFEINNTYQFMDIGQSNARAKFCK